MSAVTTEPQRELYEAALGYALAGRRVIPLHSVKDGRCSCREGAACEDKGKHPRILDWTEKASSDPEQVTKWWSMWPDASIGHLILPREFVLDVDPKNGGDVTLTKLTAEHAPLPPTVKILSGSPGGFRLHFALPESANGAGLRSTIGGGLDILIAEKDQEVMPPSPHRSGATVAFEPSCSFEDQAVATAPDWLLALVLKRGNGAAQEQREGINPAEILLGVPEGERDDKIFRFASYLRGEWIPRLLAEPLVLFAARAAKPPFPDADALKKLEQAWKYPAGHGEARQDAPQGPKTEPDTAGHGGRTPGADGEAGAGGAAEPEKLPDYFEASGDGKAEWVSPAAVLRDSPLKNAARVRTGLEKLDRATRGGIPIGSVLVLSGAPGSGKTTLGIQIARAAREQLGAYVAGFFGDEGLEGAAEKLGQQIGLQREDLEAGEEGALTKLQAYTAAESARGPFEFVSPEESLRVTLTKIRQLRQAGYKGPIVLVLDNLQGCNFELEGGNGAGHQRPERFRLETAMLALRKAARELAVLVIVISEVSRGAYASKDPEKQTAALASPAETRAVEYKSDVLIQLKEKSEGIVLAEVAKNRPGGGQKPRLSLGHDRQRATYREIDAPAAEEERDERRQKKREKASDGAQKKLQAAMRKHLPEELAAGRPGLSENRLAGKACLGRTKEAFRDALTALDAQDVFEEVPGPGQGHFWRWKDGKVPGDA